MSSGDRYRSESKDILEKIKDLERRIKILENAPRVISSAVDSGQVTVKGGDIVVQDANGIDVLRITQGGGTRPAIKFSPLGDDTDTEAVIYSEDEEINGTAQTVGKFEIRSTPGDLQEGGFLHIYPDGLKIGWRSDSLVEEAFLEMGTISGEVAKLRFVGRWLNQQLITTQDALYTGSFDATAGFSSWTHTYVASFATTMYPIVGLLNSGGALAWSITAQSASSFTVAWATGTAAKTINMWNIRM